MISYLLIVHALRNLKGEQLDSLTVREVQQLEQQIGNALRNIRLRKVHTMNLENNYYILLTKKRTMNYVDVLFVTISVANGFRH